MFLWRAIIVLEILEDAVGGVVRLITMLFQFNHNSVHVSVLIYCFFIYDSHARVIPLFPYCNFNPLYF